MIFKITNQEKTFTPRITGMKRGMCSHRKASGNELPVPAVSPRDKSYSWFLSFRLL